MPHVFLIKGATAVYVPDCMHPAGPPVATRYPVLTPKEDFPLRRDCIERTCRTQARRLQRLEMPIACIFRSCSSSRLFTFGNRRHTLEVIPTDARFHKVATRA